MKRLSLSLMLVLLAGIVSLQAQSVRPAVVEYTAAADGQFEVSNDSLLPVYVTVEAKSFTIDSAGVAQFSRLAKNIHLQLSETSLRIPPRGHRTVFYKASAEAYPAWFCIYSSFSGLPRRGTVNVAVDMPHTVYLLSKTAAKRDDIQFKDLHIEAGELHGTIRNSGTNMVRLQSLEMIDSKGHKVEAGGFPLLPGGTRDLQITMPLSLKPERLRARLNRFTLDTQIQ